jgi:hypothetical protein
MPIRAAFHNFINKIISSTKLGSVRLGAHMKTIAFFDSQAVAIALFRPYAPSHILATAMRKSSLRWLEAQPTMPK